MLKLWHRFEGGEAGCDEAGRGCLAGPVVAAAVIWPADEPLPELNDSKKLTASQRDKLVPQIQEKAVAWAIGLCSPEEIDRINILKASFLAMHRALDQLVQTPMHILVDGNRFTAYKAISHDCIIKGDAQYASIAAASILAKTHRDAMMQHYALDFPQYSWERNKGYPTASHKQAILAFGPCPLHRKSFTLRPPDLFS